VKKYNSIFENKFAKRIFLIFCGCTLVPLLVIFCIAYFQVRVNLKDQNFGRLEQTTKATAMSIYEKLLLLRSELRIQPEALKNTSEKPFSLVEGPQHFINITTIHDLKTEFNDKISGISITKRFNSLKNWLNDGMPVLLTKSISKTISRIYMVTMMSDEKGIIIAEINPAYLFGIDEINTLPPMTELTVFNGEGDILISSVDAVEPLTQVLNERISEDHMHRFFWKNADQHYYASRKALFMESRFKGASWEIVMSQHPSEIYAAMSGFKIIFPLLVLLSLLVVIWACIVFIRRNTEAVQILTNAAEEVAGGDFSHPIQISTKDEFEILGQTFNQMTTQLGHQFENISIQAGINKAATSSQQVEVFIQKSLAEVSQFVPFQKAIVVLSDSNHKYARYKLLGESTESASAQPSWRTILQDNESVVKILTGIFANGSTWMGKLNEFTEAFNLHNEDVILEIRGNAFCCGLSLLQNEQPIGAILLIGVEEPLVESRNEFFSTASVNLSIGIAKILSYIQFQKSQERFRATFKHAASGLLIFNTDGSIKQCNPFMSQILGYSLESLRSAIIHDLVYSSNTDNITDACQRILIEKATYELFEQEFRHKDGSKVWTLISLSIVRDESDEPLYFIALIQDITDLRQSVKEKRSLQEQLHQAQKMEAIGTLAGGIAHDFNNILAGILGYVELAKMETDSDAPIRGRLDKVESAALRAADLVLQILTFSRKGEQNLEHINLSPIIKEATKLLRATIPKNISLQLNIKEDAVKVMADVGQIHQIIMNLFTNAIHACEENGGRIEVMLESQVIPADNTHRNYDLESGNYLKLTVADTGCGIDQNKLEYIFDPFFTTKEQGKGTGLGLSVVHGIVKSHNGDIEVSSKPGKGTTFEIYLPVAEAKREDKSKKRNDDLPLGNERILFVDDEPMLSNVVEGLLTSLGYEVACFTDPNQALNQFSSDINKFDLVITDHGMPGISGLNLARKLTQQRSDLPVMLITGYIDQVDDEQLAKAGVQIMANKPLQLSQLAQHVRELLDNNKSSQEVLVALDP